MFNSKKRKLEKEIERHDKSYQNNLGMRFYYDFKIIFKNHEMIEGEVYAPNIDKLYDIFLNNKYNVGNNGKSVTYYNSDEILFFEANEKERRIVYYDE